MTSLLSISHYVLFHPFRCGKPKKKPCYKLLDLTGPLQIGGLPTLPTDFQIQNKDFDGCMKDFLIDEELLDFNASVANNGTEIGCPNKQESCRNAPCQHGGMGLGIISIIGMF